MCCNFSPPPRPKTLQRDSSLFLQTRLAFAIIVRRKLKRNLGSLPAKKRKNHAHVKLWYVFTFLSHNQYWLPRTRHEQRSRSNYITKLESFPYIAGCCCSWQEQLRIPGGIYAPCSIASFSEDDNVPTKVRSRVSGRHKKKGRKLILYLFMPIYGKAIESWSLLCGASWHIKPHLGVQPERRISGDALTCREGRTQNDPHTHCT